MPKSLFRLHNFWIAGVVIGGLLLFWAVLPGRVTMPISPDEDESPVACAVRLLFESSGTVSPKTKSERDSSVPGIKEGMEMLVLTRKVGEEIVIGDGIYVTVVAIHGATVRIGISAPKEIVVDRQEIAEKRNLWFNERPAASTPPPLDDLRGRLRPSAL
jgi:carbon storage regulator